MRYMLTFYAIEDEWLALTQSERETGIADIGEWFGEHARSGKIVEGHLKRASPTDVRSLNLTWPPSRLPCGRDTADSLPAIATVALFGQT